MSYEPFGNDKEWVRFKSLELAACVAKHRDETEVIRVAEGFYNFIMPKAVNLEIKGGKDAKKA